MMTFAQSWEHQERVRHQLLLHQLKSELAVKNQESATVQLQSYGSTIASSNRPISRPKINTRRIRHNQAQAVTR
jgi:hypothetical protein